MKYVVIMLSLLCSLGWGADKFVAASGSDTNSGDDWDHAYATIGYAYDQAGDADTVYIARGIYDESANPVKYLYINTASKDITFEGATGNPADVVLTGVTGQPYLVYLRHGMRNARITFKHMTLQDGDASVAAGTIYFRPGSRKPDLRIDNCIINCAAPGKYCIAVHEVYTAIPGMLSIKNSTLTSAGGGINCKYNADLVEIENNEITIDTESAGAYGIKLGIDGDVNDYPLGMVYCNGNSVRYTGSSVSHSILIGAGCDNAEVGYNFCTGGDMQMVIKSSSNSIHNNICVGSKPFLLKGAQWCKVFNNTFVGSTGPYVVGLRLQSGREPSNNYLHDNIFISTGASYVFFTYADSPEIFNCRLDYNCYYTEQASFSTFGPDSQVNFLQFKDKIATFKTYYPEVEPHGLNINPLLDDNYQVNAVELRNNDIGAKSFINSPLFLNQECIDPPLMDSNGDCKVDMIDFSVFASEWMSCGYEDQQACWE